MSTNRLFQTVSMTAVVAMAIAPQPVSAQAQVETQSRGPDSPTGDEQRGGLEEIVVTAQKRAETLSSTAAAVSVIGQNTLDNVGARNFGDVVGTLPSVSAKGLGGTISIRGLGTNSFSNQSNGTVAYHIDGIFQNSNQSPSQALYDIERVEVLRGPQGTLYGRNATGGVVNVLTRNATNEFEAFGDVSYGRWNTLVVRGAVNVPVADALAVRLVGTYENSDNWRSFDNGKHPRLQDVLTLRLATRLDVSDRLTWNTRVTYTWDNSLAQVGVPTARYDAATRTFIRAANRRNSAEISSVSNIDGLTTLRVPGLPSVYRGVDFNEGNTRDQRFFAVRSNLNYELSDALSLTYLAGYADERQKGTVVISGLQPYQVSYVIPKKAHSWSHELNANLTTDRVEAILGLYSFENTGSQRDQTTRILQPVVSASGFIDFARPLLETSGFEPKDFDRTRAVFGQLTYDLTDRLRATGGARYNWDRTTFAEAIRSACPFGSGLNAAQPDAATFADGRRLCSTAAAVGLLGGALPARNFFVNRIFPGGRKNFRNFSWKATLDYDVAPDVLAYATVATGYKAGGRADVQASGDMRFYRPEKNISYEAGIRSKLFDNTVSLNLTGFWIDYKDLQVETVDPNNTGRTIATNAGRSRSRGIEFEYAWAPNTTDRINGYVTYLDGRFRDFDGVDPLTGVAQNFRGNRLPGAPEFAARIAWSHIFDLGGAGTITPTAQFQYQTESFVLFSNSAPTRIPDYTRSDLIVRYETRSKHFSAEAFVNNIENKLILSSVFPAFNVANAYLAQPRYYGLRLGFRY